MSTSSTKEQKIDLNEVLNNIKNTSQRVVKAKSGEAYSAVWSSSLDSWYLAIEQAIKSEERGESTLSELRQAQAEIVTLQAAATAKAKRSSDLAAALLKAEAERDAVRQVSAASIESKRSEIEKLKAEMHDLRDSKRLTSDALEKAEAQLKQPAAKYNPAEAVKLKAEAAGLRDDLAIADELIAKAKSNTATVNVALDKALKEVAAANRLAEEAKIESINFRKELAAAEIGNNFTFDIEKIDRDSLIKAFGPRGVEKLKAVLEVPAFDVRGRVQKLSGFFSSAVLAGHKTMTGYKVVLTQALDILRSGTSTWVSVLAPWVEELLKDVVFLSLKPLAHYRSQLESRVERVNRLTLDKPESSFSEKVQAASGDGKKPATWKQRAAERASLVSIFVRRLKAAWAPVATQLAKAAKGCSTLIKKTGTSVRQSFHAFIALVKFNIKVSRSYASGQWHSNSGSGGPTDPPITLFDAEVD